jgi:hypothetical protein
MNDQEVKELLKYLDNAAKIWQETMKDPRKSPEQICFAKACMLTNIAVRDRIQLILDKK